jgi:uncharacterized protein (DUF1778 family)
MPTTENHIQEVSRLNFRLPSDTKEKIERAAVVSGLTVTDFAIHSLLSSAENILERHQATILSDRDRDVFLELIEAEEEPNETLRCAAEEHRRLISK